jgi:copper chaperone
MKNTELNVEGMSCGSCVGHVDEVLYELQGVTNVDVRLGDGKVVVQHDPDRVSVGRLIAALGQAGYEASQGA